MLHSLIAGGSGGRCDPACSYAGQFNAYDPNRDTPQRVQHVTCTGDAKVAPGWAWEYGYGNIYVACVYVPSGHWHWGNLYWAPY